MLIGTSCGPERCDMLQTAPATALTTTVVLGNSNGRRVKAQRPKDYSLSTVSTMSLMSNKPFIAFSELQGRSLMPVQAPLRVQHPILMVVKASSCLTAAQWHRIA